MTWLYILIGIALLTLLFLWTKATVHVSYKQEEIGVKLKFGLFRFNLYPPKEEEKIEKKPKVKKKKPPKKKPKDKVKPPLKEVIHLVKDLVVETIHKFGKYLRLEEYRVKILVATEDPAMTGVIYGVVSGVLGSIAVYVQNLPRKTNNKKLIYTEVKPDFIATDYELFVSFAVSLRVWQLMSLGVTGGRGLLRYTALTKKED